MFDLLVHLDDLLIAPFRDYAFMRRALVGCFALALGSAPVGVFLMLRRMSLTGDAMAHAILPGAAVGFLFAGLSMGAMTVGGIVAGLAVALGSGVVSRSTILREDASLAAFYLISLSVGVLIVSSRGGTVDLMHVLFGNVLALDDEAIVLIATIASLSLMMMALLFRPLVMECVDPGFLRSVSGLSALTHHVFLALVVVNLVGGFHALGTLMAVGIMILPAATARFWAREVGSLIAVSMGIALAGGAVGLLLSYHLSLAAGPAIILTIGVAWVVSIFIGREGVLTARWLATRHLDA